jgi:hypothetical protein
VCVVPGLMIRVLFRAGNADTHANGFCIRAQAPKKCKARAFTCVNMRLLAPRSADYICILDVVGVLLYSPDKIEQNMALEINTALRSMFLA